jgi:ketosteroid isomerase-like protein
VSPPGISAEQVRAFLDAHAAAFHAFDKDAVADRYSYPAHVVTYNGGVRLLAVPTREAWTAVIERILEMYRAMGVRGAAIRALRVSDMSPQVALARVRWALQGDGDQPLYEFDATDTLALFDRELKIVQVVSENEQPKFLGVMRARG